MIRQESFKSFIPDVKTASDVSEYMEPALSHQYLFERKTSPWEMASWDEEDLHNFEVDVEKISSVYYVKCNDDDFGSDFFLLTRMKYMDRHAFVMLSAGCDYTGFDCQGGGDIYVTFNPDTFIRVALETVDDEDFLLQSLREDGFHLEQLQDTKWTRIEAWNEGHSELDLLPHDAIQNNGDALIEDDAALVYPSLYTTPMTTLDTTHCVTTSVAYT
ncbi:hypothetical protein E2C01_070923 [Portunus trituberculatus]|uniref:Uncharacterized protein n=1 Tax=Portunus trituberculatus TaxID=210409 RepID=A0A5B7I4W5_PORTR|nr:hypothetical protein [Portunus trituberculatus]